MIDENSKCGNCLYWKTYAKSESGECHRHAPRSISSGTSVINDRVNTYDDDFCGDHAPGTPRVGEKVTYKAGGGFIKQE